MAEFRFYKVEESDNTTLEKIADRTIVVGAWDTRTGNTRGKQNNCGAGLVSQLYPRDFLVEVTMFTPSDAQASYLEAFGFRSVYSVASMRGKRWTFNNGSYAVFGNGRLDTYLANGTPCFALNLSGKNKSFWSYRPATSISGQTYMLQELPTFNSDGTVNISSGLIIITGGFMGKGEQFWEGATPEEIGDPYDPGGNTEPGGGEGDFDEDSDPIDFPDDPELSAVDTGFITLFNPSLSQLNDLANYMWGSLFDLENWKKLFANPMDAILGLSIVPVAVPNGGTSSVKVGNIDTGVSMTKAAAQYVNVDCGTLNIKEYWGAYLDYSPYTKAEIFLPFIGTHPLDIDDIMKKAVHVKYKVDILSGACIANIKCGDAVLYSYAGQCAATIPVTGRDWTNVVGSALSIVGNAAGAAVTGGMLAPMAAANVAQAVTNMGKPNIQKSGSVAGMAGIMGIQKPYIMLTRPRQAVPKRQNHYTGYPSFITTKLDNCSGYTEVEIVHLEGIPGTTEELAEIERLLQSGVIF